MSDHRFNARRRDLAIQLHEIEGQRQANEARRPVSGLVALTQQTPRWHGVSGVTESLMAWRTARDCSGVVVGPGTKTAMDARTNIRGRLPSRHETEAPGRAPHRSRDSAMGLIAAIAGAIAEVFKKTLYRTDSKPAGRHVAQDMPEVGGIPLLTKTLLDHGDLHVACAPVTGRTVARKLKSVNWKLHHADA